MNKMIKRARFFLLIIVIAILLVACASPAALPPAEAAPATQPPQEEAQATAPPAAAPDTPEPALSPTAEMDAPANSGYPAPSGGGESGYPAPTSAGDLSYPAPGQGNEAPSNIPETPADVPDPESGMAAVSGVVYSSTVDRIVPGTMFYLTRAVGDNQRSLPPAFFGPLDEQGDIVGKTDEKGQFVLDNVPPGNYFLIVEAPPYNWALGMVSEEDTTPRLIELQADQKYALEVVYVSWP